MPPRKLLPSTAVVVPNTLEDLIEPLTAIPILFQSSQHSLAIHRKNVLALHKLFLIAASITSLSADGTSIRLTGERAFGEKMREAIAYPLGIKKGVDVADRLIKFTAGFIGFAVDYDLKKRQDKEAAAGQNNNDDDDEEEDEDDDGPASRLVTQLLSFLLKGFRAKSKIARFRCVQLVALMINSLGELDDSAYKALKLALLERVHDKESTVRMQAVVALSKLQDADAAEESDDDDSDQEDKTSVAEVLIDVLTHDPAAEVRRAALFNLTPSPITLPALLMRTLDIDPINRRATFAHVLNDIPIQGLSQSQREIAIARGLRDRIEGVKKAASRLVVKWAESSGGVIPFIKLFDVYDGKATEPILEAIFETKPELIEDIDFSDNFYTTLTPHSTLLARVYFQHLRATDSPLLADLEPVVTSLAHYISMRWNTLLEMLETEGERDEEKEREEEFVVKELSRMAVGVDYGDEIGRRKMFELMREMLSSSALPSALIPTCLDVLLKGTSERDFLRIVVEIVQGLRADSAVVTSDDEAMLSEDEEEEEEEDANAKGKGKGKAKARGAVVVERGEERERRRKTLDLRCLAMVRCLLERVMGALQENSTLHGIVHELIVPSVKSKDPEVRSIGLICLGLCSLLDKEMAIKSFRVFATQSREAEGELRVRTIQTLFDLLVLYGTNFVAEIGLNAEMINALLLDSLEQDDAEAGAAAVVGTAKLMLSGMVTDIEILNRLVLLYFASETAENQELRQCLSYFFPVYGYSSSANQERMGKTFLTALSLLKGVYEDLHDKATMVAPLQIGLQLVDWSDPQKVISTKGTGAKVNEQVHYDLAIEMVQTLFTEEQKEERKLLCQLLPKLYIPDEIDDGQVKTLLALIASLQQKKPLTDLTSKNALLRFEKALRKQFADRIAALEVGEEDEDEEEDEEDDEDEDDEIVVDGANDIEEGEEESDEDDEEDTTVTLGQVNEDDEEEEEEEEEEED